MDQVVEGGILVTKTTSETRIWEDRGRRLVHVHFHKLWMILLRPDEFCHFFHGFRAVLIFG